MSTSEDRPTDPAPPLPRRKLLLVDDDEFLVQVMHKTLRGFLPDSWDVVIETNAVTGLSLAVLDADIAICLVDLLMPRIAGDALIGMAVEKRPALRGRIILCTAYTLDLSLMEILQKYGCLFIQKPFDTKDLENMIWGLIATIEAEG